MILDLTVLGLPGWSRVFNQLPLIVEAYCPTLVLPRQGALRILVHAWVIFWIEYCNALYVWLPLRLTQILEQVWNVTNRLVARVRKSDHTASVLACLHWLSVAS